jgi:hypothetical protein
MRTITRAGSDKSVLPASLAGDVGREAKLAAVLARDA